MYWSANHGDSLRITISYSPKWRALTQAQRDAFIAKYLADWGTSDFDGSYGGLIGSTDRQYSSRAYGMDRTRYSGTA
jgi:hypothetical protein